MLTRAKLDHWKEAAAKLAHYKKLEGELRREIADELLEGKPTGTHHFFEFGYDIKLVKKNNTSIDRTILSAMFQDLSNEEKEAIRFTPELAVGKYKKLASREMINHCLIVKPGMPELSVKEEGA